jgi:hypothetical protein
MLLTEETPGSSSAEYVFPVLALYQSMIRPTKGEMRYAPASAPATAWTFENRRVRLQLILWSRCRIRAAWIPSQVDAILIRMRDLSIPIDL